MAAPPALVRVGRIVRPHGVRGEVRVMPDTDFPQRLAALQEILLVKADRSAVVQVETVRPGGAHVLMKLSGIDSVEQAEAWRGAEVAVPRAQAAPLGAGQHYVFEVLGLRAETEDGRVLGTVTEILRTGSNDVYVIRDRAREVLVPAISTVVLQIDVAGGRVVIRPLDGMLDER